MDLAKLSIEARLRNGWQAIDLGFAMARQWYWPCFVAWMLPGLLVYSLLALLLPQLAFLSIFVVWWLKPLWDRLPLAIASRSLFGEAAEAKPVLRNSLRLFKTDVFPALTWRRFSPSRSFDLPVTVLEGLRGAERSRRLAVLHQSYGNAATWLTLVLVHVEMFLTIAIWSIAALLVPSELNVDWLGIMMSEEALALHLSNFITFCAMALVGPFYSVAGFALYICRRVELEGWDMELRFRHLAARSGKSGKTGAVASKAAGLLIGSMVAIACLESPSLAAQETVAERSAVEHYYAQLDAEPSAAEAKQAIVEVLNGEDFHRIEMESGWRFKTRETEAESLPDWFLSLVDFIDWLRQVSAPVRELFAGLAGGFELAVWLLIIAVVALLVYRFRRGLLSIFSSRLGDRDRRQPQVLFGLDVREETLPEDVCAQVMNWWQAGEHRQAVGLLYRATLSKLIHQHNFEFLGGYTEQECVGLVAASGNRILSDYLAQLTRAWQHLAYAHRRPESSELQFLCDKWRQLFDQERAATTLAGGAHAA